MKRIARFLVAAAVAVFPVAGPAQDWPEKTVRVINPFNPGGTTDVLARVVADKLQKRTGKPFVVEAKPGAGGMIGTSQVAKAEPDGHTIGVSIAGPLVLNRLLYKSMTYDPQKDLTPLTFGVHQPCMLIANKSLGVSSVPELIALVKKNPGKFNYGYVGNGSLGHLVMAMLAEKSGTQIVPIIYGAAPPATLALLAGDVHMACLPASVAHGQVKGGGVTALAVSTQKRSGLLPNLPTLQEQGYPDIVGSAWIGFVGPAGMPKALSERISRDIGTVLRDPEVVETLRQQFMEPAPTTPEEFARFMAEQLQKWKPVIEQNNIRAD